MKLLVTRPMTERATHVLNEEFDTSFNDNTPLTADQARAAMSDYDAILPTIGDDFSAAAFEGVENPRCKLLANFGAGYNHIDVAAANTAGIKVTNTPDVVTEATADIALMLILMAARRASEGEMILREGNWTGWNPTQLLGTHVSGKTVGVIGMGRIGKAIARRCHHGFGMRVAFFNRSRVSSLDIPARQVETLVELMKRSDFVVIAVPGGPETRHLVGADELEALGPESYLINIARGDVVDQSALIGALKNSTIKGAGLDVYDGEPAVPDELKALRNVTLLPHLGTATDEVRTQMALRAIDNLLAFRRDQPLPDLLG